jgi:hypothetical protein
MQYKLIFPWSFFLLPMVVSVSLPQPGAGASSDDYFPSTLAQIDEKRRDLEATLAKIKEKEDEIIARHRWISRGYAGKLGWLLLKLVLVLVALHIVIPLEYRGERPIALAIGSVTSLALLAFYAIMMTTLIEAVMGRCLDESAREAALKEEQDAEFQARLKKVNPSELPAAPPLSDLVAATARPVNPPTLGTL